MKIICITNKNNHHITIGKEYETIHNSKFPDWYRIIDDIGLDINVMKKDFTTLSDIRNEKLKQLGI